MRPRTVYPRKSTIIGFRVQYPKDPKIQRSKDPGRARASCDSMPKREGPSDVDTPTKGKISRRYQALGGSVLLGITT